MSVQLKKNKHLESTAGAGPDITDAVAHRVAKPLGQVANVQTCQRRLHDRLKRLPWLVYCAVAL